MLMEQHLPSVAKFIVLHIEQNLWFQ